MGFIRCPICKEYHFDTDKCKPLFEYNIPEFEDEDDWYPVRANSFESAAEQACEDDDRMGDYVIVNRGCLDKILIRNEEGTIKVFSIEAYINPEYSATEIKEEKGETK